MNFPSINRSYIIANQFLKKPVVQLFFILLLLYALLPAYLSSKDHLCENEKISFGSCLDPSYVLSINLADSENFVFGKDYVLTYGALGFLNTRNTMGMSSFYLIVFDLFVITNLLYIFVYAIRKYGNLQMLILCFLTAYTIEAGGIFILLLISIFWLNHSLKHAQVWSLLIPVIVNCLMFYIRVNTTFIGLAFFYIYLLYFFITDKKNYAAKTLFGLAVPCLIFLMSFPLKTYLPGYMRGGLSLIDGYTDAMGEIFDYNKRYLFFAFFIIAGFFSVFVHKNFKFNLLLLFTALLFTFIIFKQGFVRPDMHVIEFFTNFPGICCVLLIFYNKATSLQVWAAIGASIICFGLGLRMNVYPKFEERIRYLQNVMSPPDSKQRAAGNFKRFPLPPEVKKIIGGGTVDIIPWNISYLYFNGLKYCPRPVIQSYSAYTPYLIEINRQKYESKSAPDFVIFSNHTIDNRYGFFDDQQVKLALVKNYSCIGYLDSAGSNKFLLFRKNPNNTVLTYLSPTKKSIKFAQDYYLPNSSKSYFIKFTIQYTLPGKIIRTLYKAPQININFTLDDGSTRMHRAIVPILNSGVLINPLVEDENDFFDFIKGVPTPTTKRIKSFRIELDSRESSKGIVGQAAYIGDIGLLVSELLITR